MSKQLPPIMGTTEVGAYAGVSRQLAAKWAKTWSDWPEPYAVLSAGTFWQTQDVVDALKRHERKPGEGPRAAGDSRPPSVTAPKRRRARVAK